MERFRDGAAEGIERYLDHLQRNKFVAGVIERYPDFESFVMHAPDEYPRLRKPQVAFLNNDRKRADFTGRQESLEADLHKIYDNLGLEWVGLKSVNIDPAARTTASSTPTRPAGGWPSSSRPTCAGTTTSSDRLEDGPRP